MPINDFADLWRKKNLIDSFVPDQSLQKNISQDITENQSPMAQAQRTFEQQPQAQPQPQLSDYHPSVKRRILGGLLGGFMGIRDPKMGAQVAENVVYGPYQSQLADWKAKEDARALGLKEAESGLKTQAGVAKDISEVEKGKSQIALQGAQTDEARSLAKLYGREAKDPEVFHPRAIPKMGTVYNMVDEKGNYVGSAYEDRDGGLKFTDDNSPVPRSLKPTVASKERTPGRQDDFQYVFGGLVEDWKADHSGEAPKGADLERLIQKSRDFTETSGKKAVEGADVGLKGAETRLADVRATDDPIRAQATTRASTANLNSAKRTYRGTWNKESENYKLQIGNIDSAMNDLNSGTQAGNVLAIPETLKALLTVVGQSANLRLTNAEMNMLVGGQTTPEHFQAWLNKIFASPESARFPPGFVGVLNKLLNDRKARVMREKSHVDKSLRDLEDTDDQVSLNSVLQSYQLGPQDAPTANVQTAPAATAPATGAPIGISLDDVRAEQERRKKKK
jgi:hypothetical protein